MDGWIILKSILKNRIYGFGLYSFGSGCGPVVGSCEYDNGN
jgi:hypothetical protein